jgi:hypothetical protein
VVVDAYFPQGSAHAKTMNMSSNWTTKTTTATTTEVLFIVFNFNLFSFFLGGEINGLQEIHGTSKLRKKKSMRLRSEQELSLELDFPAAAAAGPGIRSEAS